MHAAAKASPAAPAAGAAEKIGNSHLGKVGLGFGLLLGVLLTALVMGWLQSLRPFFGRVPNQWCDCWICLA